MRWIWDRSSVIVLWQSMGICYAYRYVCGTGDRLLYGWFLADVTGNYTASVIFALCGFILSG